ncbi:MAG TPA: hypothetical protein VLI54_05055 [Bacillota bacterium]|nr:hypothetical protein [Bacillota bacterium]
MLKAIKLTDGLAVDILCGMGESESTASTHLISLAEGVAAIRREQAVERQLLRGAGHAATLAARQEQRDIQRRLADERRPLVAAFIELVTAAGIEPEPFQRWTDAAAIENRIPLAINPPALGLRLLRPAATIARRPPTRIGWQIYDAVTGHLNYDDETTRLNPVRHSYLYITSEAAIAESDVTSDGTEFPPLPAEAFAHALAVCLVNNGVIQAPSHTAEGSTEQRIQQ